MLQRCIFYPIAKDSEPNNGVKTWQKFFPWNLLPIVKPVSQENQY